MKLKILKSLAYLAMLMFTFACSSGGDLIDDGGEPETPTNVPSKITVSESAVKTTVLGEIKVLTVESTGNWKVAANTGEEWITIFPKTGTAGKTEVELMIKANDANRARFADITFATGTKSAKVEVTQEWSYSITLPCTSYTIGYGGGDIAIDGLQGIDYTITLDANSEAWINVVDNVLEVAYNEERNARLAKVSIKDKTNGKDYKVSVTQKGSGDNAKILSLQELYIDGYKCPAYDLTEVDDYFYSVDMDATAVKTAKVRFHGEGVQWITFNNSSKKYYSGDEITFPNGLKANSTIRFTTHSKTTSKTGSFSVIVSGLPIVEIETSEAIKDEPKVDCTIKLFDPKARTDDGDNKNLKYFESKAGIEYRGAGAMRYIKKPYNFKLYDDAGEKREAELLNIRNDNSWILDAMFLDVAHMRTRVCFDIWNQFNKPYYVDQKPKAMSGTRGHHVEVFINGEYFGLFTLTDRIDRKQYQIEQQGGYIYKAKGWTEACRLRSCNTPSNDDYYWNSADIEQEYPDADDGQKPNFNYLADMINFVGSSSQEDFNAKFEQHFDMNSVVDGFIFLNMIVAHDNIGRNTFWILRNVNESKKFIHGLWDLDGTLGRQWHRYTEDPNQGWVASGFRIYERIINENPAGIHQKIYDRWQEIKDGALAPSNFNEIVENYANIQIKSGARNREVERWKSRDMNDRPNWGYDNVYYDDLESEIAYMKDWWQKRHTKLNSLINSLQHK